LPVRQEDLRIDGWAFEARVYAEDVPKGFLPATGTLSFLSFPDGAAFAPGPVRIDSGVRQGDAISPWYDPMIAKVIVHGPTRSAALNLLDAALSECHVMGAVTNLEFLGALARHEGFARGEVDTGLIARDLDALTAQQDPPDPVLALAAIKAIGLLAPAASDDPWDRLVGWRQWTDARQYIAIDCGGTRYDITVSSLAKETFVVDTGARSIRLAVARLCDTRCQVEADGRRFEASVVEEAQKVAVFLGGRSYLFDLPNALAGADADTAGGDALFALMPGLVKIVAATAGQAVQKGDALLVLEAMKMEHTLTAPRDGIVAEILAAVGDQVTDGTLLLALEPAED
jgi:3-methylcrotonyl-CoA carboxylase alpha subunit